MRAARARARAVADGLLRGGRCRGWRGLRPAGELVTVLAPNPGGKKADAQPQHGQADAPNLKVLLIDTRIVSRRFIGILAKRR